MAVHGYFPDHSASEAPMGRGGLHCPKDLMASPPLRQNELIIILEHLYGHYGHLYTTNTKSKYFRIKIKSMYLLYLLEDTNVLMLLF